MDFLGHTALPSDVLLDGEKGKYILAHPIGLSEKSKTFSCIESNLKHFYGQNVLGVRCRK